eukprot:4969551-Ditylum_brightwellii.AAC.1
MLCFPCLCVKLANALPLQNQRWHSHFAPFCATLFFWGGSPSAWPPLWFRLPSRARTGSGCRCGMNAGA